ncbi:uncharacterized protein [Miscanthus floridulus]|uniref:uncharacterized protein isoform X2 n=1 Tax=Miscanthus floridulus TaxID=154761 RepID=UPI00345958BB
MADLALGALERIVRAALKIKKAVETVQQNKKECRDIQRCAARITALLSWLKDLTMGAVMHPAFSGPLDDLADSMEEALELITDCQQRSALRHLLGAGDMAKRLRLVHEDILRKLAPANFATSILQVQISVSVTNTLHYVGAHPPLLLPQVAGGVNSYDSNLSALEMRPGVNRNTTMVATGNAVPCASSSRLAEFNWSEGESTLHLSSEEHISEGGHAFGLKQKIVIKVAMTSNKSRSKAMALVVALGGVDSVAIAGICLSGEANMADRVVVVGQATGSCRPGNVSATRPRAHPLIPATTRRRRTHTRRRPIMVKGSRACRSLGRMWPYGRTAHQRKVS